ncbi:MAG: ABC transporter permease [Patescibacteria group bacterium]|jgi:ABC-2 type transport system permease protein
MKLHRIYAIILRYMYLFKHSFDRLSDAFYWPTIDLLLWGLTSSFLKSFAPNASTIVLIIVSGILLWIIVWRAQYEITVNLLEDLWNKNLINIFVSPLSFNEWISSFLVIGLIKGLLSIAFASVVAYILYKVQILTLGFYLLPFIALLILIGWSVGFFVAGLILRFGTRVQTFAWTLVAILMPFSAIYYPLSILPQWAQTVARLIPTSYIFEGAREVIETGNISIDKLIWSFGLNLVYLIASFLFLRQSFRTILNKGLVSVY